MESSFEGELKIIWESLSGSIFEKLNTLSHDLKDWSAGIKQRRQGLKWELTHKLEAIGERGRDDENIADLLDAKIQLTLEVYKDVAYWEQRARVNWLRMGDKKTSFFHRFATARRRKNTISKLVTDYGRDVEDCTELQDTDHHVF